MSIVKGLKDLNKASEANAAQVSAIKDTVETFSKSVDGRISELAEQHAALCQETFYSNLINEFQITIIDLTIKQVHIVVKLRSKLLLE